MCLFLLVAMNIFLCAAAAARVHSPPARRRNTIFCRYFAVLQWSYFLKEFGATAAVGVGVGRKCTPASTRCVCMLSALSELTRTQRFLAVLLSFAIYRQQMNPQHIAGTIVFFRSVLAYFYPQHGPALMSPHSRLCPSGTFVSALPRDRGRKVPDDSKPFVL